MRNLTLELYSLETTENVARKMAEHLFKGSIMLFWGDMGSGKTTFIKSLCSGLGVLPEKVTSPTYTLVNIYKCKWYIFHPAKEEGGPAEIPLFLRLQASVSRTWLIADLKDH